MVNRLVSKRDFIGYSDVPNLFSSDTEYEAMYPPNGMQPLTDFIKKFFIFSFGMHLSEGSDNQIYYNYNVTECAVECLRSAAFTGVRCLSFDFYPFESPIDTAPYFENSESGICTLNSKSKDQAILRNEDEGYTDAELYYRLTEFAQRPFSNLDGVSVFKFYRYV